MPSSCRDRDDAGARPLRNVGAAYTRSCSTVPVTPFPAAIRQQLSPASRPPALGVNLDPHCGVRLYKEFERSGRPILLGGQLKTSSLWTGQTGILSAGDTCETFPSL